MPVVLSFARLPSLELSWLPLSDRKTLPTPLVAYADLDWCGGCYCMAGQRLDDFETTGGRDMLIISTRFEECHVSGAVFAHEHRHLQQHYLPGLPKIGATPQLDFGDTPHEWAHAIRRFYRRPWELDALRYERRLSPNQANLTHWQALL